MKQQSNKPTNNSSATTTRKIQLAILVADGFQDTELFVTHDICSMNKINCVLVNVANRATATSQAGITINTSCHINDIVNSKYHGVIIPGGGIGVKNLLASSAVATVISDFVANGKLIAAICAGPILLTHTNILANKRFTCFANDIIIKSCRAAGGEYDSSARVVTDGLLITSAGPQTASDFAKAIVAFFHL